MCATFFMISLHYVSNHAASLVILLKISFTVNDTVILRVKALIIHANASSICAKVLKLLYTKNS